MHSEIAQIGIISLGGKSIAEIMQFVAGSFAQKFSDVCGYYSCEWQNALKSQKKKKKKSSSILLVTATTMSSYFLHLILV